MSGRWRRPRVRSLSLTIFGLLALGLATIQLLSYGIVSTALNDRTRKNMFDFMANDIALVYELLAPLPPERRQNMLPKLNRGFYVLRLRDQRPPLPAVPKGRLPGLTNVSDRIRAATHAPDLYWVWSANDDPLLVVPLPRGQFLLVEAAEPLPSLSQLDLIVYLVALFLSIAALSWLAISLALKPLARFSDAALQLGQDIRAPLLIEGELREVRHVAAALNMMRERILKQVQNHAQMMAAISHDLMTPITRMQLRSENIADETLRAKLVGDLQFMSGLIVETLNFARSLRMEERIVAVDLDAVVEMIRDQMVDTGHRVTVSGEIGTPVAAALRSIQRVIQNLVDNAVKYGERADILLERRGNQAVVQVRDEGPGIPAEHFASVREPFFRIETSRSRNSGGTGLGLAIADNLIRAHGGELILANLPEGGLEATVVLSISPR